MIVHGEMILRNLYYGIEEAHGYGHCFNVAYVPDAFGQNCQMPQLYNGFGIDKVLFVRGIDTRKIPKDHFIWRGEDGSEVYAVHSFGYMTFRNPSDDVNKNMEYLDDFEKKLAKRNDSGTIILLNGFDQYPIRKDIVSIVDALKEKGYEIGFESLEKTLEDLSKQKDLPVYTGEMICGETTRAHRSIYSSRADIKILNSKIENELIRKAEPLQAFSYELLGHHEKAYLKRLYKIVMENDAHDSSGCCNSDNVNAQIKAKYEYVLNGAEEYIALTKRLIGQHIAQGTYDFQVYNYLPYERTEELAFELYVPFKNFELVSSKGEHFLTVIDEIEEVKHSSDGPFFTLGLNGVYEDPYAETLYKVKGKAVVKVPSMGYETFTPVRSENRYLYQTLENDVLKLKISDNGTLHISDKKNQKEFEEVLLFEDSGDAGDSYNYSPALHDLYLYSSDEKIENLKIEGNTASYDLKLMVPADLKEREEKKRSKKLDIRVHLELDALRPLIRFRVKVNNTATDHRLRVLLKTGICSEVSHADNLFGEIKRSVYPEDADWKAEKWSEAPCTISPMQSYVYLKNDEKAVAVITDSVKEYEIVGDNYDTIAYTLYRSFPYMGRSDLPTRPGRASGKEEATPDGNLYKEMEFSFAYAFDKDGSEFADLAAQYCTPLDLSQNAKFELSHNDFVINEVKEKKLAKNYSAFSLESENTKLSIYKVGEKEGLLARFYQLEEGNVSLNRKVRVCNLKEEDEKAFDAEKIYPKNAIVTLKWEEE